MYLLDTNIVSEMRKPRPHGAVLQWIARTPVAALSISAMTIGELQAGIEKTRGNDSEKAAELQLWLNVILGDLSIHQIDAFVAMEWARLMHGKSRVLFEDAMIAATARVHGLTVVTRNVKDFADFRVPLLNPFE